MEVSQSVKDFYKAASEGKISVEDVAAGISIMQDWQRRELAFLMPASESIKSEWAETMAYALYEFQMFQDNILDAALIWQGFTRFEIDEITPDIIKAEAGKYIAMEMETAIPVFLKVIENLKDRYVPDDKIAGVIYTCMRPYKNRLGFRYSYMLADYFGKNRIYEKEDYSPADIILNNLCNYINQNDYENTHLTGNVYMIKSNIKEEYKKAIKSAAIERHLMTDDSYFCF